MKSWIYSPLVFDGNPNPSGQGQGSDIQKRGSAKIFSTRNTKTPNNDRTQHIMSSAPPRRDRYKLESAFGDNTVTHRTFKSDLRSHQRRIEVRTTWTKQRVLGAGSFGEVRLERQEGTGELRAVKAIARMQVNTHEVEALIELQDVCIMFPGG